MSAFVRWLAVITAGVGLASSAQAQVPAEFKHVPADAAIFVHVDVATVWPSKIGDTLRAAKLTALEKGLAEAKAVAGITPDMIQSVTLCYPSLKNPADFQSPLIRVGFTKPYDKAGMIAGLKKVLPGNKLVETTPGIVESLDEKSKESEFTADLTNPLAITLALKGTKKFLTQANAAEGPLTPAFAATKTATAVVGMNFAQMPDEIRGDDLPAEVRPFQPLLRSDALVGTAKLVGDKIDLTLRFRGADKAKTADAEKSLAAGVTLLTGLLDQSLKMLEMSKDEESKIYLPLLTDVRAGLTAVKVSLDGAEAVAQGTIKADLPYGPVVQSMLGGGSTTNASARAITQNNLKQFALALHNYHDVYDGFPPAAICDKKGKPMLSWRVMVLPYIEQQAIYEQFKLDEPWDSDHNKKIFDKNPMPKIFELPGVTKEGEKNTHFQVFVGKGAMFDPLLKTKIQTVTDGTSNTLLMGTAAKAVPWTKPGDMDYNPSGDVHALLLYTGEGDRQGFSVAMGDGSVRFIRKTIDAKMLHALITKGGGEVIEQIP